MRKVQGSGRYISQVFNKERKAVGVNSKNEGLQLHNILKDIAAVHQNTELRNSVSKYFYHINSEGSTCKEDLTK